jgi:hypothetical protein
VPETSEPVSGTTSHGEAAVEACGAHIRWPRCGPSSIHSRWPRIQIASYGGCARPSATSGNALLTRDGPPAGAPPVANMMVRPGEARATQASAPVEPRRSQMTAQTGALRASRRTGRGDGCPPANRPFTTGASKTPPWRDLPAPMVRRRSRVRLRSSAPRRASCSPVTSPEPEPRTSANGVRRRSVISRGYPCISAHFCDHGAQVSKSASQG